MSEQPVSRPGARVAAGRFLAVGALSVVVDTALLVVGRELVGLSLPVATTAAFVLTLGVNFGLNMVVVFEADGRVAGRLLRYLALVGVSYVLTLALVLGLASSGLNYVAAKLAAVVVCALLNFVAYRHWVFA